ncbi:MAG: ABC transporter ATP-binding protein [Lachnospiraceae bacterium]|nr:ABC transporter ATP-binding protein [Lachnospiraceae bacterium]
MLEMKNVLKQYDNFRLNCSLTVNAGCVTGFIGQNGAGKSTTFKSILDLVHIDGGEITVFDKPHTALTNRDKQDIAVVLADSGFSGFLTISRIIPVMAAMYDKFQKENFLKQCEHFGLPLNKQIKDFSTGMRAKLKVLIALSHEARLLILDEPTAGLDVVARDEILEMLREYMEQEDRAILISSHISTDLEGLCDDIYFIHEGEIILHEDTDVLLSDYASLKVDEAQYKKLDKTYLISSLKESYGYRCLTDQKQFYLENYPDVIVEKGCIDDIIMLKVKGEKI